MVTVSEWFGLKTTRTVFVDFASKPVVTVFSSLASKLVSMIFSSLASKLVVTVFYSLASKLVATIHSVWPQNWWWISWLSLKTKVVEGFSVWASKPAASVW
jgi:hypothetical protein